MIAILEVVVVAVLYVASVGLALLGLGAVLTVIWPGFQRRVDPFLEDVIATVKRMWAARRP